MSPTVHIVQYYETDKMGVTHHANYLHWMEEARVDFLRKIGWPYERLEEAGIVSPVVSVSCRYRAPSTVADEIAISVRILELKRSRMRVGYEMQNQAGKRIFEGESEHAFLDRAGKPLSLKTSFPEFYSALARFVEAEAEPESSGLESGAGRGV